MITLGHFIADGDGYAGRLRTLAVSAELKLVPCAIEKEKAPSHRLMAGDVECGAAWPAEGDAAVLNVKLDDPSWPEPVRARLVHGPGEDFLLLWRRPTPE